MSEALAIQNGHAGLEFTAEQRQMIRDNFANGASDAEFAVFLEVARVRKLNPLTRQIHLVKRWNSDLGRNVWTPQTGIDGLRSIAERTGKYDGQDEPEFEYDEHRALRTAKVRVYRKDWTRPAVGVAHFSEYAQFKKDGAPMHMWKEKPHIMLAKCAEALAIRKAFPEDTGGLYTDEEMKSGPVEEPDAAAPPSPAKPARAGLQVVEVDTKALAARRIDADATLTEKLQETVAAARRAVSELGVAKNGAAAPRAEEEGNAVVVRRSDGAPLTTAGTQSGQPQLPPGPTKLEQLLAMLDEVRISGGWDSKIHRSKWCAKYAEPISALTESEKATVRGAIEVCGIRK